MAWINFVKESVSKKKGTGIGWCVTAVLLVTEVLGGGVIVLPLVLLRTGIVAGILFMISLAIFFTYTGWLIGENWILMRRRWPVCYETCRRPYPEMALRSMGATARAITSFILDVNIFGATVVFVLLSSRVIHNFIAHFGVNIDFCWLIVIVCLALLPATYFKSPADFWMVGLLGILFAIAAVLLVLVGTGIDLRTCIPQASYPRFTFLEALIGASTIMFAFAGHGIYPTIIHDMRKPEEFRKSIVLAVIAILVLYIPLAVFAYIVYGDSLRDTVISSIQTSWMRLGADFGIAVHCLLNAILTINPINQEIEDLLKLSHKFSFQRVCIRTCVMAGVLFFALTIPSFSPIMDVIGATVIPASSIFAPILFNMWFAAAEFDETKNEYIRPSVSEALGRTPKLRLSWNIIIMVIVLLGSAVSFYLALKEFATVSFKPPCYLPFLILAPSEQCTNATTFNCCGKYKNINGYGNASLCRP